MTSRRSGSITGFGLGCPEAEGAEREFGWMGQGNDLLGG